jgi:hypothetical protein
MSLKLRVAVQLAAFPGEVKEIFSICSVTGRPISRSSGNRDWTEEHPKAAEAERIMAKAADKRYHFTSLWCLLRCL